MAGTGAVAALRLRRQMARKASRPYQIAKTAKNVTTSQNWNGRSFLRGFIDGFPAGMPVLTDCQMIQAKAIAPRAGATIFSAVCITASSALNQSASGSASINLHGLLLERKPVGGYSFRLRA